MERSVTWKPYDQGFPSSKTTATGSRAYCIARAVAVEKNAWGSKPGGQRSSPQKISWNLKNRVFFGLGGDLLMECFGFCFSTLVYMWQIIGFSLSQSNRYIFIMIGPAGSSSLHQHFVMSIGKLVEEEEGGFALWLSYLVTGAGANIVSWLILPRTIVSVGASGAVFGLFAISVLVKISWDWRKILEVLILGQFVIDKVMEAAQASAQLSGSNSKLFLGGNINHIAHLSGALVGVALIWLLSRIPSRELNDKEQRKSSLKK